MDVRKPLKQKPRTITDLEKRKVLGQLVSALQRQIKKPLDFDTIFEEAERLFRKYPFEYKQASHHLVPKNAEQEMSDFLIMKAVIKNRFNKKEFSLLRTALKCAESPENQIILKAQLKDFNKRMLEALFAKIEAADLTFEPRAILQYDVSDLDNGIELNHIVKLGSEHAVERLQQAKHEIEHWLGRY